MHRGISFQLVNIPKLFPLLTQDFDKLETSEAFPTFVKRYFPFGEAELSVNI